MTGKLKTEIADKPLVMEHFPGSVLFVMGRSATISEFRSGAIDCV